MPNVKGILAGFFLQYLADNILVNVFINVRTIYSLVMNKMRYFASNVMIAKNTFVRGES